MSTEALIPNRFREERLAAGIDRPEELAVRAGIEPAWYARIEQGEVLPTADEFKRLTAELGDVPANELYQLGYLGVIGGGLREVDRQRWQGGFSPSKLYRDLADQGHLLLSKGEVTWFERQPGSDRRAEVFVNLSCGTQMVPHLLLDTVAVLDKLGVSFVAAAGTAACCGKPFRTIGRAETAERIARARIDRTLRWGAKVHVNWCTACQVTTTTAAARRLHADGVEHPVREVQVLTFLEEQLRDRGDRVPWQKRVGRRVLVEGHPVSSPIHRAAQLAAARLLAMVPGVDVVGLYDGNSGLSPCVAQGRESDWTPPTWYRQQDTREGVRAHRSRLSDQVRDRGADTVSCQHQVCHARWSRYASNQLTVQHAVSILAEALGCAHPDRYQAAARLGDPDEFLGQTREVWGSWGMTAARARELAVSVSNPRFADAATQCSCGGGSCQESLITIDVLAGRSRRHEAGTWGAIRPEGDEDSES